MALTILHIIQAGDVCRSGDLFLDRAERHTSGREGVGWGAAFLNDPLHPTVDSLHPLPPPLSHPLSCSTFNPGTSEVSECGWKWGWDLLPAGLAGRWVGVEVPPPLSLSV